MDPQNKDSFEDLRRRADAGDGDACAQAGHVFAAGDPARRIAPDPAAAAKYYEAGAAAGNTACMFSLAAVHLRNGETQKAVALLEICAQRKHRRALGVLGDFYLRGHDVPKDPRTAFLYLQEYNQLCIGGDVPRSALSVRWDLVLYPLCLLLGVGCDADKPQAMNVFKQLADLGNLSARAILGTGRLEDPMIGERFGFDIGAQGPVTLFDAAGQSGGLRKAPLLQTVPKPHRLSGFLQKSLIADEKVLMQARFPLIYTLDAVFRMLAFSYAGFWLCYLLSKYSARVLDVVPEQAGFWIYRWPFLCLYVMGGIGVWIFLAMMIEKWTTQIILTDRRFLYKSGLFFIKMIQMNFWQIEHTDVTQSMLGGLRDYGRVLVQSYALGPREDNADGGQGALLLPHIYHPYMFTRIIEDHRRAPPYGNRQNLGAGVASFVQ